MLNRKHYIPVFCFGFLILHRIECHDVTFPNKCWMPCYNVQHMFITKYSNTLQLPMIWIYGIIIWYKHKNGFFTKWYYMILISKKLIFTNVIHFTLPSAFFQHRCLSQTNYDNEVTIIPVKTQKSNNTLRIHNLMYSHNAVKRGGERSNFHRIFYSVELKEQRKRTRNGFDEVYVKLLLNWN